MTKKIDFAGLFERAENKDVYQREQTILEFTEELVAQMERENISRAELARRLNTTPAYVTKFLRGSSNFTLDSMVRISQALNCRLVTHLQPKGAKTRWFDYMDAVKQQKNKDCRQFERISNKYKQPSDGKPEENDDEQLPIAS